MKHPTLLTFCVLIVLIFSCAQPPDGAREENDKLHIGVPHMRLGHQKNFYCYDCHLRAHNHNYPDAPDDCLLCHETATDGPVIGAGPTKPAGHTDIHCLECHADAHGKRYPEHICKACHDDSPLSPPPMPEQHFDSGCLTAECHGGIHQDIWSGSTSCTDCHSPNF